MFDSPLAKSTGWWFERGWVVCDGDYGVGWWVVSRFFRWRPDFLFQIFVQIFYNMLRFSVQIFCSDFLVQIFCSDFFHGAKDSGCEPQTGLHAVHVLS